MTRFAVGVLVLATLAACAGRSQPPLEAPVAQPQGFETYAFVFPTVDAATLDSLQTLLGRVARDSALLSMLDPRNPRTYALFRELEAAQQAFATALATPDSTGRTLYDRIMAQTDSTFRLLDEVNRKARRP